MRKKIIKIIEEEMDAIGGQEVQMPTLQPSAIWKESGRWASMGDNTSIQTSGTQSTTPNEIEAVDGSLVSVSEFNGVPTAMWFWSPN